MIPSESSYGDKYVFRTLTPDDCALLQSYTLQSSEKNSTYAVSVISWQGWFNPEYAIISSCLCIRFFFHGERMYQLPLPPCDRMGDERLVRDVLNILERQEADAGSHFRIFAKSLSAEDFISRCFPRGFEMIPQRDLSEYVYLRESLANLHGSHLQSKRNFCHRFENLYPDYEYREMTVDMMSSCLEIEREWDIEGEQEALTTMFRNWDRFLCAGGAIFVDGRMIAFTMGCPVSSDTFNVCFEKAETEYIGSYAVINRDFARHLPERFIYLNREEDLGLDGLRKSKLSYSPEFILPCNFFVENASARCGGLKLSVRDLWREAFHDSETYMDWYFTHVWKEENAVTVESDGKVVAALQLTPYRFGVYVGGVCVKEELRGRGLGTALMEKALGQLEVSGVSTVVLVPANPSLTDWYGSLGFESEADFPLPSQEQCGMGPDDFTEWQRKHVMVRHFPDSVLE